MSRSRKTGRSRCRIFVAPWAVRLAIQKFADAVQSVVYVNGRIKSSGFHQQRQPDEINKLRDLSANAEAWRSVGEFRSGSASNSTSTRKVINNRAVSRCWCNLQPMRAGQIGASDTAVKYGEHGDNYCAPKMIADMTLTSISLLHLKAVPVRSDKVLTLYR